MTRSLTEQFNIIKKFIKCHAGEGDHVQARQAAETITPAAEQGDGTAQFLLGRYFSWGYHSDCDNRKAIYWYEKAANDGNPEAAEQIMNIYRNDCPDETDTDERKTLILKWHKRWFDILAAKADNGSANAAKALMNLYVEDCLEDINPQEGVKTARKWYDRWIELLSAKASKGDVADKMLLADILLYGDDVPEELLDCFTNEDDEHGLLKAIQLYKEIADGANNEALKAEACYKMGRAYHDLGEEKKALACFKKAVKLNYHEAYAKVGDAYLYGNGVEQDDVQARKWYRKGAGLGEITAMLGLADCYKNGIGGKQDYDKAMIEYLHLAERTGNRWKHQAVGIGTALYELGNMYLNGLGVEVDLRKAYDYFKRAVSHYNRAAENALNNKKFRDFK